MADMTPVTRSKKRTMNETPPKAGEPYILLSPGGTETLSSPPEVQDVKKRQKDETTNAEISGDTTTETAEGQGHDTKTNMAANTKVNTSSKDQKGKDEEGKITVRRQVNPDIVNDNGEFTLPPPIRGRKCYYESRDFPR